MPAYLISESGVRLLTGDYLLTGKTPLLTGDKLKETEKLFK